MLFSILFAALSTLSLHAQAQAPNQARMTSDILYQGTLGGGDLISGPAANLQYTDQKYGLYLKYGKYFNLNQQTERTVALVDVVFHIEGSKSKTKKVGFYFSYSPLCYDRAYLNTQLEAFLADVGMGVRNARGSIDYGYTPSALGSTQLPNGNQVAKTAFHKVRLNYVLSPKLYLRAVYKNGQLQKHNWSATNSGVVQNFHSELSCDLKDYLAIVGMYDYEGMRYTNLSGLNIHQNFNAFSLGVRINVDELDRR